MHTRDPNPMSDAARRYYHLLRSFADPAARRVARWPSVKRDDLPQTNRREAIEAALRWIFRSQDVSGDGGSAAYFATEGRRWASSYPETTGYIVVTLLEALDTLEFDAEFQREIEERVKRMCAWLLDVQMAGGAFPGGHASTPQPRPNFFNTGQILSGLLAAGLRWNDGELLAAAERAADWMCSIQNDDGTWSRDVYDRDCRTYFARAVWPLAAASCIERFPNARQYRDAALRFVDWALEQQRPNGWIERAALFTPAMREEYRVLHMIAYAIEGVLELGLLLDRAACREAALRAAEPLLRRFEIDGVLWGEYDERWRCCARYVCVVGCAQMGRVWGKCYEATGDVRFLNALLKMNDCLRAIQPRGRARKEIRGAFPGSIPIYEKYQPNRWPNWAAKFALDSFLIEWRLFEALEDVCVHPLRKEACV